MSVRVIKNGQEFTIGGIGGETLPVGSIVDYQGVELPTGWTWYEESGGDTGPYSYVLKFDSPVSPGTNIELPCNYTVGYRMMEVYLNGEKLIRTTGSDISGVNGHYIEVGTLGETSNIIKTTSDWSSEVGDVLELIVLNQTGLDQGHIIDSLDSTSIVDALSANQGRILNNIKVNKTDISTTTTTGDDKVYCANYINTMLGDVETVLTTLTTGGGVS